MRPGEPSRTAFGAARHRAVHQDVEDGRVFADPLAWRILGEKHRREEVAAAERHREPDRKEGVRSAPRRALSDEERLDWLRLSRCEGIGPVSFKALV